VIATAVVVAVTWVILRPDGTYRIQYSMTVGVAGLFAIVVFEAAAGAGFSQHQLPVGGWWAAVALGVTAGPAAVTCLLPAAVVIVAVPYGRRNRRPWSLLTEEAAGMRAQGSFLSCRYSVGMLPLTVMT
jgi:hypothetical protein